MTDDNGYKAEVAKLRKQIRADKGIAERAYGSASLLRRKALEAEERVRLNKNKLRDMGALVRQ